MGKGKQITRTSAENRRDSPQAGQHTCGGHRCDCYSFTHAYSPDWKRGAAAKGSHRPDQRSGPQSVVSGPPEGVRSEPVDSNLRACRLIYENLPLQRSHKNLSIPWIWNGLDRAIGKEYLPANSRTSTEPMVRPANTSGHDHQDEYPDRETAASPAPSSELSQRGRIKSSDLLHSVPSEISIER